MGLQLSLEEMGRPKATKISLHLSRLNPGGIADGSRWSKQSVDHRERSLFSLHPGGMLDCESSPMPSTYTNLIYHVVFSTKNRERFIDPKCQQDLHAYLGGIVQSLGGIAKMIGGVEDHVHILLGLKPTHCLSDILRDIKKASTNWYRERFKRPEFAWQEGYAAFTVSAANQEAVKKYIRNQRDHHRTKSFREELIGMLVRAGIDYEEKYLD